MNPIKILQTELDPNPQTWFFVAHIFGSDHVIDPIYIALGFIAVLKHAEQYDEETIAVQAARNQIKRMICIAPEAVRVEMLKMCQSLGVSVEIIPIAQKSVQHVQ